MRLSRIATHAIHRSHSTLQEVRLQARRPLDRSLRQWRFREYRRPRGSRPSTPDWPSRAGRPGKKLMSAGEEALDDRGVHWVPSPRGRSPRSGRGQGGSVNAGYTSSLAGVRHGEDAGVQRDRFADQPVRVAICRRTARGCPRTNGPRQASRVTLENIRLAGDRCSATCLLSSGAK